MTVEGIPQLTAKLMAKAAAIQAVTAAAVAIETAAVRSDASRGAPVLTGELAGGVEGQASGTVGTVRVPIRHGAFQEFGTSRHAAQPFMAPAAARSKNRFIVRVASGVRKAAS